MLPTPTVLTLSCYQLKPDTYRADFIVLSTDAVSGERRVGCVSPALTLAPGGAADPRAFSWLPDEDGVIFLPRERQVRLLKVCNCWLV